MTRENRFAHAFGLAFLMLALSGTPAVSEPAPAPGLVLITIDTLRADHVSAYNAISSSRLTPNIDRLAASGVLIEHGASPTPTTGPAFKEMGP